MTILLADLTLVKVATCWKVSTASFILASGEAAELTKRLANTDPWASRTRLPAAVTRMVGRELAAVRGAASRHVTGWLSESRSSPSLSLASPEKREIP
jgi:hypothetical protein